MMNKISKLVKDFNILFPVGTEVKYYPDTLNKEDFIVTKVDRMAYILPGGKPMLFVEGIPTHVSLLNIDIPLEKYIILDLDGTISDDKWRIHRIRENETDTFRKYHEYQMLSGFDDLINEHIFRDTQCKIIIITSRTAFYATITLEWLDRNKIPAYMIIMRDNDDHLPAMEYKQKKIKNLLLQISLPSIICAYDDRKDVVEMYREFGLNAQEVINDPR